METQRYDNISSDEDVLYNVDQEEVKYKSWIESCHLVYDYLHIYNVEYKGRNSNQSFINWLDKGKVKDKFKGDYGDYSDTSWLCLTTSFNTKLDQLKKGSLNIFAIDSSKMAYNKNNYTTLKRLQEEGMAASIDNNKFNSRKNYEVEVDIIATCLKGFILLTANSDNVIKINKIKRFDQDTPLITKCYDPNAQLTGGLSFTKDDDICVGGLYKNRPGIIIYSTNSNQEKNGIKQICLLNIEDSNNLRVKDVELNDKNENFYGATNKSQIIHWDPRAGKIQTYEKMASGSINSIDINPYLGHALATGSDDGFVKVWDLRNLSTSGARNSPIITFDAHSESVNKVRWSPHLNNIIASSSKDKYINVYNAERNELVIAHPGHRYPISDFEWNNSMEYPNTIASIDKNPSGGTCTLQVWAYSDLVYHNENQ